MPDLKIADLVDDPDASEWLDYPDIPGVRVQFSAPDNPAQVRLAVRVAGIAEIPDQNAEFYFLKVRQSVAGWDGLKVKDLGCLFPGKKMKTTVAGAETIPEGQLGEAELAYSPENLDFLLRKSGTFYRWVNAQVNAREVQEAADLKNS